MSCEFSFASRRLASSTTPANLEALLPHLFASGFSHPLINSFLRLGLPMTFPGGIDWSPATARDRGCCRDDRCFSLWRVFSSQVSQQVDSAVPNAAQFGGHCDAVKRTLAFGPNRSDEHAELVCKREKPLFDKISAQLLSPCGLGHCHDSSRSGSIDPRVGITVLVPRRVADAVEHIPSRRASDYPLLSREQPTVAASCGRSS